jgi:hypothetical protein
VKHNNDENTEVGIDSSTNQAICLLVQHQLVVFDVLGAVAKLLNTPNNNHIGCY